jgi:flagellar motility protein MotE (MotC chaperone)
MMAALLAMKSVVLVRNSLPPSRPGDLVMSSALASERGGGHRPEQEKVAPKQAEKSPEPTPTEAVVSPAPLPIPDSERTVLLELRERRNELDARESALNTRESVLAATEQKLNGRIAELTALQRRLEALEVGRSEREEASWQGLVKVYETMKPRDAAAIFNDLDQPVLLNVLDRMKESKAAPVLSAMNTDKAREVTAQLAQLRSKRNAPVEASGQPAEPVSSTPTNSPGPAGSKNPG